LKWILETLSGVSVSLKWQAEMDPARGAQPKSQRSDKIFFVIFISLINTVMRSY